MAPHTERGVKMIFDVICMFADAEWGAWFLMIESMRIKGFRGFEDLHVTGIKPVTLFGGSNNAGKSSVLEAVLLHGIVTSENYFLWLANMRNGSNNVVMKPQYVWAPMFYRFAQTQELMITCPLAYRQKTELRLAEKNGTPVVGYKEEGKVYL